MSNPIVQSPVNDSKINLDNNDNIYDNNEMEINNKYVDPSKVKNKDSNYNTPKKSSTITSIVGSLSNSLKKKTNINSPLSSNRKKNITNNSVNSSPLLKTPQSKSFPPQDSDKPGSSSAKKKKSLFSLPTKSILRTPTPKKSSLKSLPPSSPLSSKTPTQLSPLTSPSLSIKRTRSIEIITPNLKRSKIVYSPSLTRTDPVKSKLQYKSITPIKESSNQQKERLSRRKSLIPIINKSTASCPSNTPSPKPRNRYLSRLSLGSPLYHKNIPSNNTNPFIPQFNNNDSTKFFDEADQESNIFITQSASKKDLKKTDDKYRRKSMFIFGSSSTKKN